MGWDLSSVCLVCHRRVNGSFQRLVGGETTDHGGAKSPLDLPPPPGRSSQLGMGKCSFLFPPLGSCKLLKSYLQLLLMKMGLIKTVLPAVRFECYTGY